MKSCNIFSLKEAYEELNEADFQNYLDYLGINLKPHERYCLKEFCEKLSDCHGLDGFFIGYEIPQIGTEFDIIRVGEFDVVNIELKSESTEQAVLNQLKKNKYYLNFIEKKEKFYFTYIVSKDVLYQLDESDQLIVVEFDYLNELLCGQDVSEEINLDTLFKPNNYLVSPFNSTDKFIKREYFLTTDQVQKKKEIIKSLKSPGLEVIAITGNPGTGKTLLTYDIALTMMEHKKVAIVHCGNLNAGQIELNSSYSFNIIRAKNIDSIIDSEYELIIVDEAQRMYSQQLEALYKYVVEQQLKCIFSYDARQVFTEGELSRNNPKKIEDEYDAKKYNLTNKIRSNRELSVFTQNLFNKRWSRLGSEYKNIKIQYFTTNSAVKTYASSLKSQGWKVLNYTTSNYNYLNYDYYQDASNPNAHDVIGQEFENVAVVIDSNFKVIDRALTSIRVIGSPGYDLDKMLYQMITRAREKLIVIVLNNPEILERCIKIIEDK